VREGCLERIEGAYNVDVYHGLEAVRGKGVEGREEVACRAGAGEVLPK
jgi:hypothetical protein